MIAPPLRLGIVGCGRVAEHGYLPAIAGTEAAEVVALADPIQARRESLALRCKTGPSLHIDAQAMIADAWVEAVIVASPAGDHVAAATAAAAAGLACLVEKPPGPDVASARALAELSPAPWIGFNRRFSQGLELIELVPSEGELELELELRYRRASWQAYVVRDDVLLDLAPHLIDLSLLIAGGPAEVVDAVVSPERAELMLELDRGPARIRCAADRSHLERAVVRVGGVELAASRIGGMTGSGLSRLRRADHPLVASLRRQVEAFAAAARGGDSGVLATADDGVRVMEVVDGAASIELLEAAASS